MSSTIAKSSPDYTLDDLNLIDRLVGKIDNEYRCSECKKIMIDVWQADNCGCRYCSGCLDEM